MTDEGVLALGRAGDVVRSGGVPRYLEGRVVFEGCAVEWDVAGERKRSPGYQGF